MNKHLIPQEWIDAQMEKHKLTWVFKSLIGTKFPSNPCVALFGPGPANTLCKTCKHLARTQYSKTYIKCKIRGITRGPGTDHKVSWPACAKWEADIE